MIEIKLGDRYAKSILQLAREQKALEEVKSDFDLIKKVCDQNPDFVYMLKSPLVFSDRKQNIINKIFGGKLSKMTSMLLEIIIRKKREPWLYDIAVRFLALHDIEMNNTRGILVSAAPISPEVKQRIKTQIEKELKTTFFIEEKIDPSLIGGFVLRIGDYQFDGSIANGIRQLEQNFSKNLYVGEFDIDIP